MKARAIDPFVTDCLPRLIRRLVRVIGLACLCATAAPASADALSSGRMGPLTIMLYDLDAGDGIAPSLTFSSPNFSTYLFAVATSSGVGYETQTSETVRPIGSGLGVSAVTGLARADVSVVGVSSSPALGLASAAASGAARALADNSAHYAASTRVPDLTVNGFTVSPHTLALFSVRATADASTTLGYDPSTGREEFASASVSMGVYGSSALGSYGYQMSEVYLAAYAAYHDEGAGWIGETDRNAGLLGVTFSNLTDFGLGGTFYAGIDISGESSLPFGAAAVSPAPEPETCALLLAGLAMTVGLARRRKAGTSL
jgi:hypothetical protein